MKENLKEYEVVVSVCATVLVEAKTGDEAMEKVREDFSLGENALIQSINTTGYEIELENE